jgi:hypothetical protein
MYAASVPRIGKEMKGVSPCRKKALGWILPDSIIDEKEILVG